MEQAKKTRLEAGGWKVGTVQEFLDLSREEAAYIELRLDCLFRPRRSRRFGKKDI